MARGRKPKDWTPPPVSEDGLARLPVEREKNGYKYTQIDRSNKAAVYKMTNTKEPTDTSVHYEVFKILISPPVTLINRTNGKEYKYPMSEKFPGNENFGTSAWTYMTEPAALDKYNEIK